MKGSKISAGKLNGLLKQVNEAKINQHLLQLTGPTPTQYKHSLLALLPLSENALTN